MRSITRVTERVVETPSTVTLRFDFTPSALPGQFVMLWIPGDDEIPMSLSYTGTPKGVTVKAMGSTSRHVLDIPVGAQIGIRGPYGNTFDLHPRRILIVAGGSGAAVLAPAAEAAIHKDSYVAVALGATTEKELLFEERFLDMGADVHVSTDDGSRGFHGYVTPVAERLLVEKEFEVLWTCGPEPMMRKAIGAAQSAGVRSFGSVERHMKCALGMCDACALDGFHVCVDGPVFPGSWLLESAEFGRVKREASGQRTPLTAPSPRTAHASSRTKAQARGA